MRAVLSSQPVAYPIRCLALSGVVSDRVGVTAILAWGPGSHGANTWVTSNASVWFATPLP